MAREDWVYLNLPKSLYGDVQQSVESINKASRVKRYNSARDFILKAIADKIDAEAPKIGVKA